MGHKVYVDVTARFNQDGAITPIDITWADGKVYSIDRVLNVCRAASLRGGGLGMRYACRICGKDTFLWRDNDRWYVESKRDM